MRPISITIGLTPADADGVCAAQTKAGAGELSVNGALAASVGVARLGTAATITITCAGDETVRTFIVTGKDSSGRVIVEKITGVSASAATSTYSYREVSRIEVDAATADAVTAGVSGDADAISVSQTPLIASALTITGVLSYDATMFGIADNTFADTVKIYSAGNDSARAFAIFGQDANGADITESLAGSNAGTSTSAKSYRKVYAIRIDAAAASTVYAGWTSDLDGIAKSQSITAAGYLVMNGTYCTTQARHISITGVSSEVTKTFTVVGLDRYGDRITEEIEGPGAGLTVKGVKNFSIVQAVYVSAALTGNVTVGSADECESQAICIDRNYDGTSVAVEHSTDSTLNHTVTYSLDNILSGAYNEYTARWHNKTEESGAAEVIASMQAVSAIRLKVAGHDFGTTTILMNFPVI